jgi:hypothetical protein
VTNARATGPSSVGFLKGQSPRRAPAFVNVPRRHAFDARSGSAHVTVRIWLKLHVSCLAPRPTVRQGLRYPGYRYVHCNHAKTRALNDVVSVIKT